ncbi:MAG: hypothetical protein WBY88_03600 [Desulfosarcina sp.]
MTEFNPRISLQATSLLIMLLAVLLGSLTRRAEATVIKDLRIGSAEGSVRLVLEFDQPLTPPPSVTIDGNTVQVTLAGNVSTPSELPAADSHGDLVNIIVSEASEATRIDVTFAFEPAEVNTFALADPQRFIVDAYRSPASATARPAEDALGPASSNESPSLPGPSGMPEEFNPAGLQRKTTDAKVLNHIQTQQRLLVALIVVTPVLVALLFLLVWIGGDRGAQRRQVWMDRLPPARDPDIEKIDAAIAEHFNIHDRL